MHRFQYRGGKLFCEQVSVSAIAQKVGTPFYLYSRRTLVDHFQKIKKAFAPVNPLICFAMKANGNLALMKTLIQEGAGIDIVSGGELQKALRAGANPHQICYASVGKTKPEIRLALEKDILFFNVESVEELKEINLLAKSLKRKARVALRLNPDVGAVTHAAITTGTLKNKFGIDLKTAREILINRQKYAHLEISGLHVHIGSQITTPLPFVRALKKVLTLKTMLDQHGITLKYLDIGGGMAADYIDGTAQPAEVFAKALVPLLKKINLKVIMEPGRFIVANAGIFVTKVLYLKDNGVKKFLIVDGAMNDLIRPSLYDSFHQIIPVQKTNAKTTIVDVVGPICESGDYLGKHRRLPHLKPGDLIAVLTAGAYGYAMSSNYNARCRAPEVMVSKNHFAIVKERETFNDLIRGEHIPDFIK